MILVRFNGGLGNQLFQYAAGRQLSLKFNTGLVADLQDYQQAGHPFLLDKFNVNMRMAGAEDYAFFERNGYRQGLFRKLFNQVAIVHEPHFHYSPVIMNQAKKHTWLQGYWQCEKYFSDIRNVLLNELKPAAQPGARTLELMKAAAEGRSVAIHVRRGDYVSNAHTLEFHGLCDMDYYQKAIAMIEARVEQPVYFVFSDDIDWAKEHIRPGGIVYYSDHTDAHAAWEDLMIMKSCSHNIIANSTFSWWGAWLGEQPDKTILAPAKWFAKSHLNANDVIPEHWIKIS